MKPKDEEIHEDAPTRPEPDPDVEAARAALKAAAKALRRPEEADKALREVFGDDYAADPSVFGDQDATVERIAAGDIATANLAKVTLYMIAKDVPGIVERMLLRDAEREAMKLVSDEVSDLGPTGEKMFAPMSVTLGAETAEPSIDEFIHTDDPFAWQHESEHGLDGYGKEGVTVEFGAAGVAAVLPKVPSPKAPSPKARIVSEPGLAPPAKNDQHVMTGSIVRSSVPPSTAEEWAERGAPAPDPWWQAPAGAGVRSEPPDEWYKAGGGIHDMSAASADDDMAFLRHAGQKLEEAGDPDAWRYFDVADKLEKLGEAIFNAVANLKDGIAPATVDVPLVVYALKELEAVLADVFGDA